MELRWTPSVDMSALHAAWVIASGRELLDPVLQAKLAEHVMHIVKLADAWNVPHDLFWRHLLGLAADLPSEAEMVSRLNAKLCGLANTINASQMARPFWHCKAAFQQMFPNAMEELQLRSGPLQLAWEARGPGLTAMIKRLTDEDFLVESAGVVWVRPLVGGDGLAHIYNNRVHMEAVLTNIEPRLPETLRLAWLLGQLNLDRPVYSDRVHGHALGQVAELALIPVVLAAAQEVELAELSLPALDLALLHWTRTPGEHRERLSETLMAWWETATEGEWDWNTRLGALSKMLG